MYSYHATESIDAWAVFAWLVAAAALWAVVQLWRGMRLDPFERAIRRLREQPSGGIQFAGRKLVRANSPRAFQVRLLPLMLVSAGLAMLLSQAVRPDGTSRTITWLLCVAVGTWHGTHGWNHFRGISALRNFAWGGVVSGAFVSAIVWAFYLAVDRWHGDPALGRIQSSVGSLLWFTSAGALAGGWIGSFKASRVYRRASHGARAGTSSAGGANADHVAVCSDANDKDSPWRQSWRRLRRRWGLVAVGCLASALFHLSAAPHAHRVVHFYFWDWHWHPHSQWQPSLTLTMTPSDRSQVRPMSDAQGAFGHGSLLFEWIPDHVVEEDDGRYGLLVTEANFDLDARSNVMQAPKVTLYNGPVPYFVIDGNLAQLRQPGPGVIGPGPGELPAAASANGEDAVEKASPAGPAVNNDSTSSLTPTPLPTAPPPPENDPIVYERMLGMRVNVVTAKAKYNGVLVAVVRPETNKAILMLHTQGKRIEVPVSDVTNIFPSDTGQ